MNGADFFLVVNFLIGLSFAVVFLIVSTRSRSRIAARWIAAAYAIASFSTISELLVAHTEFVKFFALTAFATVLAGLLLIRIGIGRLYGVPASPAPLIVFYGIALVLDLIVYELPRGTWVHSFSYQTPFALAIFFSATAVLRSSRRAPIDRAIACLLFMTGFMFIAKAAAAVLLGAGATAKDYVHSYYALVSQSSTGVFVVLVGLMLLSVFVLEIMAQERSNSEVDALSEVLNRRGFDNHCDMRLRRLPGPHALILCDLDHFKKINDTYGHYSGDCVIRAFADLLKASAPENAVVGRLGGEEFCVLLPGVPADAALMFAQAVRGSFAMQVLPGMPSSFRMTASFGVATFQAAGELSVAVRNADAALYEAKASGRNCVRLYRERGTTPLIVVSDNHGTAQ
ncbi:GGDEF domain-containing protein [Rhizobium oryzicola]|uniref:diguanylate cyclase n=1 Tax=Rhizobium oryzicola TaxID=1232668 RepID=A0ABT8SYW4_9HYPH|nr:GGDEF domain-containing protein [Rhizobium oryzicola]MDO1583659.1 GGDEF domain-containing protein [Rhizobium oryzicola]